MPSQKETRPLTDKRAVRDAVRREAGQMDYKIWSLLATRREHRGTDLYGKLTSIIRSTIDQRRRLQESHGHLLKKRKSPNR